MDNFSLARFHATPTMPGRTVQNPDRPARRAARRTLDLAWGKERWPLVGTDLQENQHSLRATMNQDLMP